MVKLSYIRESCNLLIGCWVPWDKSHSMDCVDSLEALLKMGSVMALKRVSKGIGSCWTGNDFIVDFIGDGIRQFWILGVGDAKLFEEKSEGGSRRVWKLGGGVWKVQNRGGEGIWPLWRKGGKGAPTCLRGKWRKFWHFSAVTEKELLTLWLMLSERLGGVCGRVPAYCTGLCTSWIWGCVPLGVECGEALHSLQEHLCYLFLHSRHCSTTILKVQ